MATFKSLTFGKISGKYGDVLPATGYVRQSQLLRFIPFSSATLWRKVSAGQFPRPRKLSERVTAWDVADIRAWMESRQD